MKRRTNTQIQRMLLESVLRREGLSIAAAKRAVWRFNVERKLLKEKRAERSRLRTEAAERPPTLTMRLSYYKRRKTDEQKRIYASSAAALEAQKAFVAELEANAPTHLILEISERRQREAREHAAYLERCKDRERFPL